ncbi:hypothetical protein MKX03_034454, partial [Papaver bracteatum]
YLYLVHSSLSGCFCLVTNKEEFASQSTFLNEFASLPTIEKAWVFKSENEGSSQAIFSISQPNLLGNSKRTLILSSHIAKQSDGSDNFNGCYSLLKCQVYQQFPTYFEIWGPSQVHKEIHVPKSVHGSVYTDGWFEGISWRSDETLIAYGAEDPCPSKPVFDGLGYKKRGSTEKDCNSWKGQGDFEETKGKLVFVSYSGKRRLGLSVVNIVSVGQVVWAPKNDDLNQYLVFLGWPSDCGSENIVRKLGMKHGYIRPCALYIVKASVHKSETDKLETKTEDKTAAINLTQGISTLRGIYLVYRPDGKSLVFLSAKSVVDTGIHSATESLHRIDWPTARKPHVSIKLVDVVPVVQCAEEDCFPGYHRSRFLCNLWLSDGHTMVLLTSATVDGRVSRVIPNSSAKECTFSLFLRHPFACFYYFSIMKIPVHDASVDLPDSVRTPYEAICVSSKTRKSGACDPLIVILHGGPHSILLSNFSKNYPFLSTLSCSLLIVNYRDSLGFGEEALQSLPGKIGSQV